MWNSSLLAAWTSFIEYSPDAILKAAFAETVERCMVKVIKTCMSANAAWKLAAFSSSKEQEVVIGAEFDVVNFASDVGQMSDVCTL